MQCPTCQHDNPGPNARFCAQCGASLAPEPVSGALCPGCGALLDAADLAVCPACGQTLRLPADRRTSAPLTLSPRASLLAALAAVALSALVLATAANTAPMGSFWQQLLVPGGVLNSVPWATVLLFFWSLCLLLARRAEWRRQRSYMRLSLAALEERSLRERSAVAQRVWLARQQLASSGTISDVYDALRYQADIDADRVSAAYSLPRLFIWAMPVLGFIGTVLGISLAVGQFSGFLRGNIEDVEHIKQQLVQVTQGLSFAFLTTLLGLVCSLGAMLAAAAIQNREENFLNQVDRFCLEQLVTGLNHGQPPAGTMPQDAVAAADGMVPSATEAPAAAPAGT